MPSRQVNIAIGVGATVLTLAAGYAAWFDYKRQTDKQFRKKLRKDNKKINNHVESVKSAQGAKVKQDLVQAVIEISAEPTPRSPEESERYFMENVSIGERLSALGPEAYVPAAISFYRALRIYPAPAELMQMLVTDLKERSLVIRSVALKLTCLSSSFTLSSLQAKTVLPPVFETLRELIAISNTLSSANISQSSTSNPAVDALAAAIAAATAAEEKTSAPAPSAPAPASGLNLSEETESTPAASSEDKDEDYEDVNASAEEVDVKETEGGDVAVETVADLVAEVEAEAEIKAEAEEAAAEEIPQAGETVGGEEEKQMLEALQAALSGGETQSA
ncbi:Translocase of outer mitochondrial membrane complex, subunit TOM20 [Phaffia rhodozyma]|uniref:Translocase of outer mitochondrial membrane complex, subunit TOM20 n=1 Tax=Phaffia rhodozyma TaxID=264483 RepID=A0A0F7SGB6_PHARH|nr:Translocase of outer mitochondrial membrane complex, subunit TOM20 [Phaffia rhodozyma]